MNGSDDFIIQITSDSYGGSSGGLGENLMKAYIYALTETIPRPKTILFINTGAYLTAEGSAVLDSLKTLEAEGVEIMTCGTCIDYFNLCKKPEVGTVTNMYTMVGKINNAGNTIII